MFLAGKILEDHLFIGDEAMTLLAMNDDHFIVRRYDQSMSRYRDITKIYRRRKENYKTK